MYNSDLIKKPTAIIVNKMDTDGAHDKLAEVKDKLKNINSHLKDLPDEYRPEALLQFDEIVTISAKDGKTEDIDIVKNKLRLLLDLHASNQEEEPGNLAKNLKESFKEKGPVLV